MLFDKHELFLSSPAFELLLTQDGAFNAAKDLKIQQLVNLIPSRESASAALPMLYDASQEVVGYANIERLVALVGQDVDKISPTS